MRTLLQGQPAPLLFGFAEGLRAAGLMLNPLVEALFVTFRWSRNLVSSFGLKSRVENRFKETRFLATAFAAYGARFRECRPFWPRFSKMG